MQFQPNPEAPACLHLQVKSGTRQDCGINAMSPAAGFQFPLSLVQLRLCKQWGRTLRRTSLKSSAQTGRGLQPPEGRVPNPTAIYAEIPIPSPMLSQAFHLAQQRSCPATGTTPSAHSPKACQVLKTDEVSIESHSQLKGECETIPHSTYSAYTQATARDRGWALGHGLVLA